MNSFDDAQHSIALSEDGSYTAYSKEYDEHYHSTKDGALSESLYKHIIPAYKLTQGKDELHILDICYGLGFNTLATVLYYKEHAPEKKLFIYSPELDSSLVQSLTNFNYPQEFASLREIIEAISRDGVYRDETLTIEVFLGDAREYIKQFQKKFDIVYQDAFSPSANPMLWTKEYFADIKNAMKSDGVVTTYSTALKTRLALYENGFLVYLNKGEHFRNATLASLKELVDYELVNMQHKISCNPGVEPLSDTSV
ncbi:MnmC family methyltransferase [Sulfurimonas sp. NWX79]|uniref:tRNA (5-methylaminomethyl-2-thiouridine)(34)-methyltransferase MnmD n=1 Tax=Sulfurimonas sp. NWX79 TaxID=2925412 RepID=UPI003204CC57